MSRVDEFWEFMVERELIRQRRLVGLPQERWTDDWIFQQFSFTNVKRYHDRTTQLFNAEFYAPFKIAHQDDQGYDEHPCEEALLNASIYRLTGTIHAARAMGWSESWDRRRFETKIGARIAMGEPTFTAAYIVPNAGRTDPKHEVVGEIIDGIVNSSEYILDTPFWKIACGRMCGLFGVGSFIAKEILLDYILATDWTPDDWSTWTPIGPGARKGASWVRYGVIEKISEVEALEVCQELYAMRDERWPECHGEREHTYEFPKLELTDVQFQLCEVAKYQKAKTGVGQPKRKFKPTVDDVTCAVTKINVTEKG